MNQRMRVDLLMMVLDLRLAASGPNERIGERLPAERLLEIAEMLEGVVDWGSPIETGESRPANDPLPGPLVLPRRA